MRIQPPLILAYHAVADLGTADDPRHLATSPVRLQAQVAGLRARGYEFVKMADFAARLHGGARLRRVCALTFDDGTRDNATVLPGLLADMDVPATLFVCPGLLGARNPDYGEETGVRMMSADELRVVSNLDFIEIGSHTSKHTDMSRSNADAAYAEMASSKQALEELIGKQVSSFAYPYCLYSPSCPDAARRAGYTSAVTCGARGSFDPYELRRQMMDTGDGRLAFALKSRDLYHAASESPPWRAFRSLQARARD